MTFHKINEGEEKEVINLLKNLIKIPSSSKDGSEIYEFVRDHLAKHGMEPTIQSIENPHISRGKFYNLYFRFGNGNGPKIMINGHLDTVGSSGVWLHPEFEAYEEKGSGETRDKIFGLGAADMKGGCASAIAAVKALRKRKNEINGELFLSFVFGEEAPFSLGADTLLREHDLNDFDLIIVTEPSPVLAIHDHCLVHKKIHEAKFPVPVVGAEGRIMYEIKFYGKASHGSHPSQGINALQDAAKVITKLSEFNLFSNIQMGRGHYCVLNIEGGDPTFTVPAFCSILVNRQLTLGETETLCNLEIERIIDSCNLDSKAEVNKRYSPGTELEYKPYICTDSKYFDIFMNKLPEPAQTGTNGERCRFTTSSVGDFNLYANRTNVPTLVFGPGGENIHSPNEFVYTQEVIDTTSYLLDFFTEVL